MDYLLSCPARAGGKTTMLAERKAKSRSTPFSGFSEALAVYLVVAF